ncbi:WXG100 family type VII secretion target [Nocardia wallacei]|uniref:WXG100 family type VII secretion target n=1 Tax=Nocardia wallacei TaxID=480035 RepID=UPI00245560D3|nr:WXG100 family type VII secretion target [Nocardia wallacei]
MDPLRVDPAALRATQPRFTDVATRVKNALTLLQESITAEGRCWGDDEVGKAFETNYVGIDELVQSVNGLSSLLTGIGESMTQTADLLSGQDGANAGGLVV